jgi:hypothetical protein
MFIFNCRFKVNFIRQMKVREWEWEYESERMRVRVWKWESESMKVREWEWEYESERVWTSKERKKKRFQYTVRCLESMAISWSQKDRVAHSSAVLNVVSVKCIRGGLHVRCNMNDNIAKWILYTNTVPITIKKEECCVLWFGLICFDVLCCVLWRVVLFVPRFCDLVTLFLFQRSFLLWKQTKKSIKEMNIIKQSEKNENMKIILDYDISVSVWMTVCVQCESECEREWNTPRKILWTILLIVKVSPPIRYATSL